jgi:hypothetical protein
MDRTRIARETLSAVRQLGQYGKHFQSQDVRVKLGYDEQSPEAHYMHNVVGRLKKQGIVEVVGDAERKRNQYLMIIDEAKLRERIDRARGIPSSAVAAAASATTASANGVAPKPAANAPRRVVYLEERVADLEAQLAGFDAASIGDRLESVESKVTERLDAVEQKVQELVDLWS